MSTWNLKDQFSKLIDHWYLVLGCITLGALVGWGLTMIFPAPYRASADLYVGIDVTRVNEIEYIIPLAAEEPLNLDDYKNWQLKQVADIFYSDPVLEETLSRLKADDQFWSEISLIDVRESIDIYWYDTGIWRLQFLDQDPARAEAAVQAWLDAGHDYVSDLLEISAVAAGLDAELEINKDAAGALKIKTTGITAFLESTADWLAEYSSLDGKEPLPVDQHEELLSWVQEDLSEAGSWFSMGDFPPQGAPADMYQSWLETTSLKAQAALEELEEQQAVLQRERDDILPAYHASLEDSLGLSANIVLEENSSLPYLERVRNPGQNALGGALIGLIGYLIFAIIQVRELREDQG